MDRRTFIGSLAVSSSALFAGCSIFTRSTPSRESTPTSPSGEETLLIDGNVISISYEYNELEYENLPQQGSPDYEVSELKDLPNISTYEGDLHPTLTARKLLSLIENYRASNDKKYINKARMVAESFVNKSISHRGGIFFPYEFTFQNGVYTFEKPWYSGMAQGIALSAYTRGYIETGSEWYRERADEIFKSLVTFPSDRNSKPWVVAIDEKGYYWIEEYPKPILIHTLNGFNFAIWGLYEYWLSSSSPLAKRALDASITTVKNHLQEYRRPNKTSRYWLGAQHSNPIGYHNIHIRQLNTLYDLTGDHYFQYMAQKFEADTQP